jgi:hypothetical protein
MGNKIKKYSWIHQLNAAALETKLISEAKLFEQQMNPFEQSISQAGGDVDIYRQIKKRKDLEVEDVDNDGDKDAEDVKIAVDPSLMTRYPSLQRGMGMGSRNPDVIAQNLLNSLDQEVDKSKRMPNRPNYGVGHLEHIARILGQ